MPGEHGVLFDTEGVRTGERATRGRLAALDVRVREWIAARRKGKGTLHHPHDQELDLDRITEVVRLLVAQR